MLIPKLLCFTYRRWLIFGSLFYLLFPFILFLAGWIRPIYGLPACLLLIFCAFQTLKQSDSITIVAPPAGYLLAVLLLSFLWCFRAGLGEWTPQSSDFIKHNLVFADLVRFPWPVCYTQEQGQPFLCYYLSYYLPIALIGKLVGLNWIPALSFMWSAGGLFLFFNWILIIGGQNRLGAILGFTLLSGLKVVHHFLFYLIGIVNRHYFNNELKVYLYELPIFKDVDLAPQDTITFTHSINQWIYTPQQALGGWLAVVWLYVMLQRREYSSALLISTLTMFYSPFAALGFVVIFLAYWPKHWRTFISIPNMLGSAVIGFFLLSYYFAHYPLNASGWNFPKTGGQIVHDLSLIFSEVVLLFLVARWLYYRFHVLTTRQFNFMILVSIVKILCMFFYVGYQSDLLQRLMISLSSLFFIFMGIALQKAAKEHRLSLKMSFLFAGLIVLSFSPINTLFIKWKYLLFNSETQPMSVSYLNFHYSSINKLDQAVYRDRVKEGAYDYKVQYLGYRQSFFGRCLLKSTIN